MADHPKGGMAPNRLATDALSLTAVAAGAAMTEMTGEKAAPTQQKPAAATVGEIIKAMATLTQMILTDPALPTPAEATSRPKHFEES